MNPEVADLLKRALALSVDERAALANTLLDSVETESRTCPGSLGQGSSTPNGRPESGKIGDRLMGATPS
jgi:hypothetical protein